MITIIDDKGIQHTIFDTKKIDFIKAEKGSVIVVFKDGRIPELKIKSKIISFN